MRNKIEIGCALVTLCLLGSLESTLWFRRSSVKEPHLRCQYHVGSIIVFWKIPRICPFFSRLYMCVISCRLGRNMRPCFGTRNLYNGARARLCLSRRDVTRPPATLKANTLTGTSCSGGSSRNRSLSSKTATLRRTGLYDFHVGKHGKMVPFAGFSMPLQYDDLTMSESHRWTREKASLFDVGHMWALKPS